MGRIQSIIKFKESFLENDDIDTLLPSEVSPASIMETSNWKYDCNGIITEYTFLKYDTEKNRNETCRRIEISKEHDLILCRQEKDFCNIKLNKYNQIRYIEEYLYDEFEDIYIITTVVVEYDESLISKFSMLPKCVKESVYRSKRSANTDKILVSEELIQDMSYYYDDSGNMIRFIDKTYDKEREFSYL